MIWVILVLLLLACGGYLMWPFFTDPRQAEPEALDEARQQRATIDLEEAEGRLNPEAAQKSRDALDRRVLELLDRASPSISGSRLKTLAQAVVPAILLIGGVAIYTQIGSPNYRPLTFEQFQAEQIAQLPDTLEELVVELRAQLEADSNPPVEGYVLLARSHLRLRQVEAGLAAYDKAIEISGGDEEIVNERDQVVQMLQSRAAAPQIDPEAQARIAAMSPDEQTAMIEGMVDGLAARLAQDPSDAQGWMRLIRARAVMGQIEQARFDLATAQKSFPPDTEAGQALQVLASELLPPEPDSP